VNFRETYVSDAYYREATALYVGRSTLRLGLATWR